MAGDLLAKLVDRLLQILYGTLLVRNIPGCPYDPDQTLLGIEQRYEDVPSPVGAVRPVDEVLELDSGTCLRALSECGQPASGETGIQDVFESAALDLLLFEP